MHNVLEQQLKHWGLVHPEAKVPIPLNATDVPVIPLTTV